MEAKFKVFDVTYRGDNAPPLEEEVNDYLASIPGQIVDVKMQVVVDPAPDSPYRACIELFMVVIHHPD